MSERQLVLANYRQESRAKRILGIFKPRGAVTGEPFNLHLTFKNDSEQEFPGGKCELFIDEARAYSLVPYEAVMPSIKPKESTTIVFRNRIIEVPGYTPFRLVVKDVEGKDVLHESEKVYRLSNASREELYQKYAVVVALFFSILATLLTIVNVLVSIFA